LERGHGPVVWQKRDWGLIIIIIIIIIIETLPLSSAFLYFLALGLVDKGSHC
jgi:hypothetical protein